MKILLAGCGDVATEAGLRFLAQGHQATAWRRSPEKLPAAFNGQAVDLLAPASWPRIDPDTELVLFTPVPASRDAAGYEASYLQAAGQLVARLKQQCPGLQRFIYISSTAVTGGEHGQWVDESAPYAPARPTAQVLADTEQLLLDCGLPVTILRASGIYGPGRTRLIDQVRTGAARLPSGSHWTNRIHRDDLAAAVVHVAALGDAAAPLYLASDEQPAQLGEVYEFLAAELGLPVPPASSEAEARAGDRRLSSQLLRDSGFSFSFPDYRSGYRDILAGTSNRHP